MVNVWMRLIPTGIAALVAGFAFGFALPSGEGPGSHESQMSDAPRVRMAGLGIDTFVSAVQETARRSDPASLLGRRVSFDERFLFDDPVDSFDQRFAVASVASAPVIIDETPERTGSVLRVARGSSGDAEPRATANPAAPKLASAAPASATKKIRLAALEMPKGSSVTLDPESRTAIYDISARTVYMPDGRRLEAHSGLGDRMDDPRYVNVRMQGATPPNIYDLTLRERPFHGDRALRLTPVGDGKMYGRAGLLTHSYLLGSSGQSNGCVSFRDYPAFLNAYLRGEVTRLMVVERLDNPPSTQFASGSFLKSLKELFSGPERTASAAPERATGYAPVGN